MQRDQIRFERSKTALLVDVVGRLSVKADARESDSQYLRSSLSQVRIFVY